MGQIHMVEQGSEEWRQLRAGKITGSQMSDVLNFLKKANAQGNYDSQARKKYKARLIAERLTGKATDDNIGNVYAIRRGREWETAARVAYELKSGNMVNVVGMVDHATIENFSFSPDGLVGADGFVEYKVPYPETHIQYIIDDVLPDDYEPQVHTGHACCEDRPWCDFMSFCPEMPEEFQTFIVRVPKDRKRCAEIEDAVVKFDGEIRVTIANLTAIRRVAHV